MTDLQFAGYVLLAALHVTLLGVLLVSGNWRLHPNFTAYIALNLFQGGMLLLIYSRYGPLTETAQRFAWTTEAGILCARALAINEICRRFLGHYRGIWALAWRLLAFLCLLLAFFSIASAKWKWERIVTNADFGLEFTIVLALVALFAFARYYGLTPDGNLRLLAVGFLFLSCVNALNDTVLANFDTRYGSFWVLFGEISFSATLLLWIWTMRQPLASDNRPAVHSSVTYRSLSPEINLRLQALNENLRSFFDRKARET